MNNEKVLTFIGLMRRAGRLEPGMDSALEAINSRRAYLIVTSADISPNSLKKVIAAADTAGVERVSLKTGSTELGRAIGRGDTAIIAICDGGFAKALKEKIRPAPQGPSPDGRMANPE